jgi:hypothetical protein
VATNYPPYTAHEGGVEDMEARFKTAATIPMEVTPKNTMPEGFTKVTQAKVKLQVENVP